MSESFLLCQNVTLYQRSANNIKTRQTTMPDANIYDTVLNFNQSDTYMQTRQVFLLFRLHRNE